MSDGEISALLGDYNFTEDEIPAIMKKIKSRDFESVLRFVEELRGKTDADKEKEKSLEVAKEYEENLKAEARFKEMYRERLMDKIKANREEMLRKNELEDKSNGPTEKTVQIDSYIKFKAVINSKDVIVLGFDDGSTVNDLYQQVKSKTGSNSVVIRRFGHAEDVQPSDKPLLEYFHARFVMIDVEYK